ncbi:MAG: PfkB family carbohydrate kinase [Candidatus Marinimicrobia bacterium]|jgi:sugar/nucleoside kinase (ribokinase family)|nr:sugar kinase [Candidatus Neomarinimicrobiota bacterium]MDP6143513.1 PfkB family carbohydrate kinase [Candidatus Neomarinimicrobiota bacterium]MDP6261513.1 PfkB family carbohydrate kinase [Candidatus Neomarinimicrobiota bacterium]MDP7128040.1 PfkB family carbohydrate kinase [Candidatus Neomarinimicrobiota bacterium]MDP7337092.1 PfkB family carbohydrate kinase [Candidatus Neomarinimicrobiota bacterium]|tara:strand:+ start:6649 stop:7539 length:891 start_codon:yes stop_codon:yes gene_type:complete
MTETILIIGSIALDTIENIRGKREDLIGGSTTYVTVAAGRSVPVNVVGVIGNDFPDEGLEIYQRYANSLVDLECKEGNTFRWGGRYGENMDSRETLFTDLGVFSDFSPRLSTVNKNVSNVFLANIHPSLQLSVINQMAGKPLIVTDTMNLWIETTKNELLKVLKKSDILLINESEAELISGTNNIDRSAVQLRGLGPSTVVIKKGSSGAVLFHGEEKVSIGAYPVKDVIDTTGAGDTFGGGFVSALASGGTFRDALIKGSALASICVEGFGVESLLEVNLEEIKKREKFLHSVLCS